jgi:hypothetical protein
MPRPPRQRRRARARSAARAPQDGSYKHLFSHPEMVEGLLRDFVQEDWLALIDFSTLEKRGGSYVTDDLRDREDDIIWRVRVAGDWLYVYLLIEFQSQVDPWMAVRVMLYTGLLYQDLIKHEAVAAGELLPPVFPLVLYNGSGRWTSNSKFGRHRATPGGCGARDRRAGFLTPSGAPYPPYSGAGFVGWISAAHPPSASRSVRCWRRPPKFGTAVVVPPRCGRGNTLLKCFGARHDFLPFVAERNPAKLGKKLPGGCIPARMSITAETLGLLCRHVAGEPEH